MSMAKIKPFSVTSVNFGSILNVTNLIIQITGIFKTVMNPGIIQIVAAPLSSLSSNKNITQWRDLEHNPDSSLALKSTSNLELLVNQFNNATPQIIVMTLKKILYSNIMTQRKCITLEIPHKNKSVPLLHILACSLNKNFDDLQHLLSCTKKTLI